MYKHDNIVGFHIYLYGYINSKLKVPPSSLGVLMILRNGRSARYIDGEPTKRSRDIPSLFTATIYTDVHVGKTAIVGVTDRIMASRLLEAQLLCHTHRDQSHFLPKQLLSRSEHHTS